MSAIIAGVEVDIVKFDHDGTVGGYLPTVLRVAKELLAGHLAERGKIVDVDQELFRGRSVVAASRDLLREHGFDVDDNLLDTIFWQHHNRVNEVLRSTKGAFYLTPGLTPLLQRLQECVTLCLVSSNTHERMDLCLELGDITHFFDPARRYSSYAPHIEGHKPHPAVYLHAIKAQNAIPARCAAVEDSIAGVQAAVAAEIEVVIGYTGDYFPETIRPAARKDLFAAGATMVIDHWREFPVGVQFRG
jgi:beta-phosphoglucomutase-like phosphatase (HAD superfamily)